MFLGSRLRALLSGEIVLIKRRARIALRPECFTPQAVFRTAHKYIPVAAGCSRASFPAQHSHFPVQHGDQHPCWIDAPENTFRRESLPPSTVRSILKIPQPFPLCSSHLSIKATAATCAARRFRGRQKQGCFCRSPPGKGSRAAPKTARGASRCLPRHSMHSQIESLTSMRSSHSP